MKTGTRIGIAALVATASCLAAAGNDHGGDRGHDAASFMQGSWASTITARNCVTGDALTPALKGFSTYHQGGTLSEDREASPTSPRGAGHGIWYRSGKREFAVKIVFQRYDLNGFLVGTQEILATNTVARDSRTATIKATFKVLDNNGATLFSGCADGEAQRIVF